MTDRRRLCRALAVIALAAAALASAACSSSGGSGSAENAPVDIKTSQLWVTVENKAGMALTDIVIEIIPAGSQVTYETRYYRLESGEKRDFAAADFTTRDNTPFNIRVSRPRAVRVTAKDITGKPVSVEVPWR
jgi:ABC-type glycerol-3-phosphate transport system substrate-binding protein